MKNIMRIFKWIYAYFRHPLTLNKKIGDGAANSFMGYANISFVCAIIITIYWHIKEPDPSIAWYHPNTFWYLLFIFYALGCLFKQLEIISLQLDDLLKECKSHNRRKR